MSNLKDRGRAPRRSRKSKLPPIQILDVPSSAARFADIREIGIDEFPDSPLKRLLDLEDVQLKALAEIVIAILDARAGDPDIEEDSEDCCGIGEDIGSLDRGRTASPCGPGYGIGDADDAEDSDDDTSMSGPEETDPHH